MDTETRRIWEMIGALSDAFWHRITQPGVSFFEALVVKEYRPESDEEEALWTELTAPHNYAALLRYVDYWKKLGTDLYADTHHAAILAAAAHRWQAKSTETRHGLGDGGSLSGGQE